MTKTVPGALSHVAVVTVSYGSEHVLPAFLAGLTDAQAAGATIVVADNAAVPESAVERIATAAGARYAPLDANYGYGGAINRVAATLPVSIEWILVSNPDVVLEPHAIDELVAAGSADDSIGSVGPAVLTAEGEVYPSARDVPSIRVGVGHALFANLWPDNPWTSRYQRSAEVGGSRDAGWLSGSCVLVRRVAFEKIGGFDTGYFMYFEDVDLGYRLGKAGYRNLYQPAAVVTHTGAHSTRSNQAAMVAAHHDSARRFLDKKYSGWRLAPVRWVLGVGLAARSWLAERRADT
ncbi:glycosyltransferase family 2 protein [uncultured Leifsonia sp.]|uniref:glycosyltransferase family 2 protein n=1 Tax=uncultured Leifsonia sp. TaxID=340359 RepID=UPI0025E98801|nr:glycosyltransferase family 2 protein [uncultured Leifsonia sp.]